MEKRKCYILAHFGLSSEFQAVVDEMSWVEFADILDGICDAMKWPREQRKVVKRWFRRTPLNKRPVAVLLETGYALLEVDQFNDENLEEAGSVIIEKCRSRIKVPRGRLDEMIAH